MAYSPGSDPYGTQAGSSQGVLHMFWLSGMSCEGCTTSALGATTPTLEDLMIGRIPGAPQVILHHPNIADAHGHEFMEPFMAAAQRRLGAPYAVIVEGSIPDDQALGEGQFAGLGTGAHLSQSGRGPDQPARMTDWVLALAPGADFTIAIGTCATWGGIPAAAGNITGSMGLMDFLGSQYRSAKGMPVVNVPGCAPIGDNFTETLTQVLLSLYGVGPTPEFDALGRPAWQFGETVHRHCPKAGYYEEGVFAEEPGDLQCLVEIGCWGPVVQCNIVERGAVNHMGGCMVSGGVCIGCTMPGFPDKYSPFYKAPPGSAISGGISKVYGGAIRRLRRMSMKTGNREPIWDRADEVPTPWARGYEKFPTDPITQHFYKKLQYRGSVHQGERNKKQPQPKSLDILRQKGVDHSESVDVLQEKMRSREDL